MKRSQWILPFLAGLIYLPSVRGDEPADLKATINYLRKLQTSTGGFLSMAPQPNIRLAPNLRATSSALSCRSSKGLPTV